MRKSKAVGGIFRIIFIRSQYRRKVNKIGVAWEVKSNKSWFGNQVVKMGDEQGWEAVVCAAGVGAEVGGKKLEVRSMKKSELKNGSGILSPL